MTMNSPKASSTANTITIARGQALYSEGEPADCAFFLETGLIQVCVNRGGKLIEIYRAAAPQCIGDELMHGLATRAGTAIALNEAMVIAIPAQQAVTLFKAAPPLLGALGAAMLRKENAIRAELTRLKLDADDTPCPARAVSKLFAVIHRMAAHGGALKNGATTVTWATFKKFCQRVFNESPVRLEQTMQLLSRLGYARLEMIACETDPDGPDELGYVHFEAMDRMHAFSVTARSIEDDRGCFPSDESLDRALALAEALKAAAAKSGATPQIRIPASELAGFDPAGMAEDQGVFERLGLDIQIEGAGGKETLSFAAGLPEQVIFNCRVVREINEWNRKGFVVEPPELEMKDPKKRAAR